MGGAPSAEPGLALSSSRISVVTRCFFPTGGREGPLTPTSALRLAVWLATCCVGALEGLVCTGPAPGLGLTQERTQEHEWSEGHSTA